MGEYLELIVAAIREQQLGIGRSYTVEIDVTVDRLILSVQMVCTLNRPLTRWGEVPVC